MKGKTKTIRATRLLWSLTLGLGLALLWVVMLRPAVEAQPAAANLAAFPDEPGEAAQVASASAPAPPRVEQTPSDVASLSGQGASFDSPPAVGGAPGFAPAAAAFTRASDRAPLSPLAPPMPGSADLEVCMTTDRVWGLVGAGETVTVSVNGAQMGAARANGIGFFWTTLYDAGGNRPGLGAGDQVRIYRDGVQVADVTLRAISGQIDVVNNVVSGTIGGVSSPISVTVYAPEGEPSMISYSQTVSTDGVGNFGADFAGVCDIVPWDEAAVAYVDGGVEVHRHVYSTRFMALPSPLNLVFGWTTPGGVVTVTVYSETAGMRDQVVGTAEASGQYMLDPTILTSDTVFIELADGTVMSRTADILTENIDPANDRITGVALPGVIVRGFVDNLTPVGWRSVQTATVADATGVYTLDFAGLTGFGPGQWVGVHVADAEGDDLAVWGPSPSVEVNQTYNEVSGYGAVPFGLGDGWPVTLTLYSAVSDTTFVYSKGAVDWSGQYNFTPKDDGLPDIAPGDVVTVESAGCAWQGVVQVMTMTVQADMDANQFTGAVVSPTERVELDGYYDYSQLYPVGGSFDMLVTATSPFTGAPAGFDVDNYLFYGAAHRTANDYIERIDRVTDGFGMWLPGNGMWAMLPPVGTPYTFTLYDNGGGFKAQLTGTSPQPIGGTGWRDFWSTGEQMQAGDRLQVQSAAGFSQTVTIPDITVSPDLDNDVVTGDAPANTLLYVSVDGQGEGCVPTDSSGHYAFKVDQLQSLWGDGQLVWGGEVAIGYIGPQRTLVFNAFNWPQIRAHYDMEGRNDVWGDNAPAGATVIVTVSHPISGDIATGSTIVGMCDGCSLNQYRVDFADDTVVADNTVTVSFGSGYVDSVTVLPVTAEANPDTDVVTVTTTPGYSVGFNADGPNGWWEWWWNHNSVEVDPSGVVVFDVSGEYDIVPGTNFNVHIDQAHGHQTHYSFWLPAPDVGVWKWNTSGHARPGGKYVYGVEYHNDGDGVAADTLIVDTLPMSTTYFGDTSGFTHVEANGVITWHLGDLAPGEQGVFMVALDVDGSAPTGSGTIAQNCVTITTSAPGDNNPDNDFQCTNPVDVWESEVDVSVGKNPNPGDPAPGQEFEYQIHLCSERGAAYGPVWLTDTLPLSTTFVSWRRDNWQGAFWTEVVTTGGQFVLYAPGLPGNWCQTLYLRLLLDLDAPLGTVLQNTIVITTPGDADSSDDRQVNTDARVGAPRYDMQVSKDINSSVLVPGGWIDYHISYWNQGNSAVHALVTDTLPPGASYQPGSAREQDGGPAFPPALVTDEVVVWDLGVIGVNEGFGLDFTVDVSDTVAPGDVLTNCASVGITQTEDTPWDNVQCVATTIYTTGRPNLYVRKEIDGDYEPGNDTINYRITLGNYGDQTAYNATLTETVPADTSLDWYNVDWRGSQYTETASADELVVIFERIEPGWSGEIRLGVRLDDSNARFRWYTNTVEIDTPPDDANPADNADEVVAFSGGEVEWVDLDVYRTRIWGCAPQDPVTVATAEAQMTFGDCWDEQNFPDTFDPGDTVTVTAGAGTHPVVIIIPDPFTGYASSITDTVWGQIDALDHEPVNIDLWNVAQRWIETDASGHYSATFADVPRGAQGDVNYYTTIDYAQVGFHHHFQTPEPILWVDYYNDMVNSSDYEVGHAVWITVTESDSITIKATAMVTTDFKPWGGTGFWTDSSDWSPSQPDIVLGDWVFGLVDNGQATQVQIGTITGTMDTGNDSVSGRIYVPWFTQMLAIECHPWGAPGPAPSKSSSAMPDGSAPYFCQWDPDTEWDVLPGQDVGVWYIGSDSNWVGNGFREPAPDLRIQTWADGSPAEGGNFTFHVQSQNGGEADAEDVVITGTLQGATYLTDTSGFPHTGGGSGPIAWDLGTVEPGDWIRFDVFVQVTAVESETITHTVQIVTSNLYDQGGAEEKYSEWSGHVAANDTHLNVGKSAWTNDPAPGYDVVFSINTCNYGSTASSEIVLTDTLHPSLTLQSWWAQYTGWQEVSSDDHHLIVAHPSIPGGWCSEVYLRAYLDENAWQGMSISNTAVISASNDIEDNDNETTWWGSVGSPHVNPYVNKNWEYGQLVPGGEMHYEFTCGNGGNVPVHDVWMTDTLPVSTTLLGVWRYDHNWNLIGQITPIVGPGYAAWEVGTIDNGYWDNYVVLLWIDGEASLGTSLTHTIAVSRQPIEDRYDDNALTWVDVVVGHGPNLRVSKQNYQWTGWNGRSQIQYEIRIQNFGDVRMENVWITDTYPLSTTLESWWQNHGPWITATHDAPDRQLVFWVQELNPGDTASVGFRVDLDGAIVGIQGLVFTNTLAAPFPDDTYPADNYDQVLVYTGPDVYVEKWLSGGVPKPGAIVTFTVEFGNRNLSPWDGDSAYGSHITDTLPPEMTFVDATAPWDPSQSWLPNQLPGNVLIWDWGTMWSNSVWTFDVAVQISDTVAGGDVLTNVIAAYGDSPNDVEPFYDNNVFELPVTILNPRFEIGKVYAGNRVAGTVVTYTLTVTNVGNETATGVVISDTVPADLEDVESDGTLSFGWLWWALGPIAPYGGADTAEFHATLPCTVGLSIVNDDYGVRASDQGVSGPAGAPVSFSVISPTLVPTFTQSASEIEANTTVYFTDTSTTDGAPLVAWGWDFGDGGRSSGRLVSHTYGGSGAYTVTLSITDSCGIGASNAVPGAVSIVQTHVFLPLVLRNY
jgi:uncharacterized repeat protein (TIGR01451 family)